MARSIPDHTLNEQDALLIVDVQRDFCAGGALEVPDGDAVVPVLNGWIARAVAGRAMVAATRDWHPANHISFREQGGMWPPHCVRGTAGAEFHPELKLPPSVRVFDKATSAEHECLSALAETAPGCLLDELIHRQIRRVWVGGLALDYCVQAVVYDALQAGFEVHLLAAATRAVQPLQTPAVLAELEHAGAIIE